MLHFYRKVVKRRLRQQYVREAQLHLISAYAWVVAKRYAGLVPRLTSRHRPSHRARHSGNETIGVHVLELSVVYTRWTEGGKKPIICTPGKQSMRELGEEIGHSEELPLSIPLFSLAKPGDETDYALPCPELLYTSPSHPGRCSRRMTKADCRPRPTWMPTRPRGGGEMGGVVFPRRSPKCGHSGSPSHKIVFDPPLMDPHILGFRLPACPSLGLAPTVLP